MKAKRIGFLAGVAAFLLVLTVPPPGSMPEPAWIVAGLVVWMAAWWMTEALPLSVTALLPFLILPLFGVMGANAAASAYYSPIIFLLLGGAFIALAIERTGLHRRLALTLLKSVGHRGGAMRLMLAFMIAAAILSMLISNTSTTLIMMPVAIAVLAGGGLAAGDREGLSGGLPIAIAFAASIGGLGTIVGSPTNAIAVGMLDTLIGVRIGFAQWMAFGIPVVLLGIPLTAWIIGKVQKVADHPFDSEAARDAIDDHRPWTVPEKRLVPVIAITFLLWMSQPLLEPLLPENALTDGTIAIAASLALFLLPDGTGRKLLVWEEADRAPWSVLLMFGGGLAVAAGMSASELDLWLGEALLPLGALPLIVIALAVVALVIVITEFASNVATASGIIPVVASLVLALGADPLLLAMPAAMAASWGFMLPSGTGPNAIAWSTGRVELPRMVKSGIWLDLTGAFLIVGVCWAVAAFF